MKRYINTGKTKVVEIKTIEYYCDNCGKKLDKTNPKNEWTVAGEGVKHGCKNNPNCNPFHPDAKRSY